ncbi:MAG: nuclear transport factor 2 family protein [Actinomycetota bacterium]|nr:nuclear transport factor 2 family protein [Actinomycetota bacterium]
MSEESPKRQFYDAQIRYLQAGDVAGLIDNQYTQDATLISFDNQITGNAALKEYFAGYLKMLGSLEVLSTDKFVETDDSLFFQATVKTDLGQAVVFDAWVLRDGKISHHFTGVMP